MGKISSSDQYDCIVYYVTDFQIVHKRVLLNSTWQIFIELLLCAGQCAGNQTYKGKSDPDSGLKELTDK